MNNVMNPAATATTATPVRMTVVSYQTSGRPPRLIMRV